MGQATSAKPSAPARRCETTDKVVAVDRVAGRGSLPISCRYTSSRALGNDFSLEPKVVGSGMSGPVRLATGRGDGRKYAVKSFRKTGMSARHREELKSEAEIYLSLDHPHVARLEMVYETDEELHLVMEYMQGGELYDRLAARKQYTEVDAAEATNQMLLAIAYLHAHQIAHRDLKLENFLYERKDTNHLKMIDFGFAKFTDQSTKMSQACGSIHYVAPEVLAKSYTERADMWSLGVIVFMLLTGSPPFFGSEDEVLRKIKKGNVHWSSRFGRLPELAKSFVKSLLVLEPSQRMSAQEALSHAWIRERHLAQSVILGPETMEGLRSFARASRFRRNVLSMMAWSLSTEDRIELRRQFLAIDEDRGGTISMKEFKDVLENHFGVESSEAEAIFKSLDTDCNDEIEYSEFLAAALLGQLKVHEDVLRKTFKRFDADGDGKIDNQELRQVLGETFSDDEILEVLKQADTSGDGKLDYDEFLAYFHTPEPDACDRSKRRRHTEKLGMVVESIILENDPEIVSKDKQRPTEKGPSVPLSGKHLPMLLSNLRSGFRLKA